MELLVLSAFGCLEWLWYIWARHLESPSTPVREIGAHSERGELLSEVKRYTLFNQHCT